MTKGPNFVVKNVILCEDIRQEKTNKFIFIGVFSGGIVVSELPARVPIAMYVEAVVPNSGTMTIHLRYSGPGEGAAEVAAGFETTMENQPVVMPVPKIDVLMEQAGTFKIEYSDDRKRWVTIIEKEVSQGEITVSNDWPPPFEKSPPDAQESSSPPGRSRRGAPRKR